MLVVVAGIGALSFAVVSVTDFMVEGQFAGLLEGRRMDERIARMNGHHVIAGMGVWAPWRQRSPPSAGADFVVPTLAGRYPSKPSPDTVLRAGDRLVVLGTESQLRDCAQKACRLDRVLP